MCDLHLRSHQSLENKRHVKSVKIGASLFVIAMLTYAPIIFCAVTGTQCSGYTYGVIYINNFVNFFVYSWIDTNFRNWILSIFWKD